MLRRESDSHDLFSSGETSDNDCEVRSFIYSRATCVTTGGGECAYDRKKQAWNHILIFTQPHIDISFFRQSICVFEIN